MLPLRYEKRWRLASGLLLLGVLMAAVMPAIWFWDDRVQLASWFGQIDKWSHVASFAVLALWFSGQYARSSYWRIALALLAYGVLIELCQRMVGYRHAEWADVVADIIGIALGLLIAWIGMGGWSQRFESWLTQRKAAR